MKLKGKPVKPKLKKKIEESMECYGSLQDVVDWAHSLGADLKTVTFELHGDYGYGYSEAGITARFVRTESKIEHSVRKEAYQKRLDAYNRWYSENEAAIEAEVALRREKALESQRASALKEKAKLEKQLARLGEYT